MSKQYGLTVPVKNSDSKPKIFGSDSDSDSDGRKNLPTAAQQNVVRRQDLIAQQKALEEDPTVYQYDEVYDEMDEKKKDSKLARKDIDKKPKYINRLLQSAARRKRENELRIERQVQKERVAEGDAFKDKEEFVTSAYRKKLEELRELEEQEKREEYLEKIGDVTKQEDLGGFYRHLYEQQVKKEDEDDDDIKKKETSDKSESEGENITNKTKKLEAKKEVTRDRKYRKRDETDSDHSDSDSNRTKQKRHLQSNLDADSDFSIESTGSETEDKKSNTKENPKKKVVEPNSEREETSKNKKPKNDTPLEFEIENKKKSSDDDVKPPVVKKRKIDVWKKRTTGEVLDNAIQRYYERKNARLNG